MRAGGAHRLVGDVLGPVRLGLPGQQRLADGAAVKVDFITELLGHAQIVGAVHLAENQPAIAGRNDEKGIFQGLLRQPLQYRGGQLAQILPLGGSGAQADQRRAKLVQMGLFVTIDKAFLTQGLQKPVYGAGRQADVRRELCNGKGTLRPLE